MVKIIVTITAFLISLISLAQVSEYRDVSNFSKLKVSQSIQISYTISDKISVKVETDDKEKMELIKTEVVGETLKLYIETENYAPNGKKRKYKYNDVRFKVLKIIVSGPNLDEIKASSSADVKIENTNTSSNLDVAVSSSGSISGSFNCTNLTIDASSSGDFTGKINATSVGIESSSSSDVNLSGKATKISVKASSSSDCNLKDFTVEEATIGASSSADVSIRVTKSIEAKASSSASISYYGNPSAIKKEESSSGSVKSK